jgi:ATP-binding protein involved in chromosome partitioning
MSLLSLSAVENVLAEFKDPETGRSAKQLGQFSNVKVEGESIALNLGLTSYSRPLWKDTQDNLQQLLASRFPTAKVTINIVEHARPAEKIGQIGLTAKSVIAVGSGKGGVGKSTVAASLALGLKRAGCKVGLMDADVYGPSIPHLLGLQNSPRPEIVDQKIQAPKFEGMPVISMGFLIPPGEAVVWRGPMLHGAVTQFLRDTAWGDLDYLIIDMPPGTGDIALTLSQMLPLTGAVVVCTPQEVALLDAVKAIAMFRKVNIPILGMVENMSGFLCPDNGKRYDIFGSGGARLKAEELQIPFLGDVPLTISIREHGDRGEANDVFNDPQTASYFERIVYKLAKNIADTVQTKPAMPSLPVL